jgi:hypothetical protein
VNCPDCGHENPAEAKFCLQCGTRFGVVAVNKVIPVRCEARGMVSDWPLDGNPDLRSALLREPSPLLNGAG